MTGRAFDAKAFRAWLAQAGADLRPLTNPYEVARFIAHGGTHVVYTNARGTLRAKGVAEQALNAFREGRSWGAGVAKVDRRPMGRERAVLVERDGWACFFCGRPMTEDDMSVEHLVPRAHGGPHHTDNLALAHVGCNMKAANLPLVAKIAMFCEARCPGGIVSPR